MARLEPIAMRLEVKEGKNNCVLINDSYNSDLASLDIALDFFVRRSEKKGLKRTLILVGYTGNRTKYRYALSACGTVGTESWNRQTDWRRSRDFFLYRLVLTMRWNVTSSRIQKLFLLRIY